MDEKLRPVTPGELLLEEFLLPMGITRYRLAEEALAEQLPRGLASAMGSGYATRVASEARSCGRTTSWSSAILRPRQVVSLLEAYGFAAVRQRDSHEQSHHADGRATTVPFLHRSTACDHVNGTQRLLSAR